MLLLDFCSGKGFTATLLSMMMPDATVVMLDANGGMGLAHVAARPNLSFVQLDLFDPGVKERLGHLASQSALSLAVGVHLCGS